MIELPGNNDLGNYYVVYRWSFAKDNAGYGSAYLQGASGRVLVVNIARWKEDIQKMIRHETFGLPAVVILNFTEVF